jgi:formate transporter
LLDLNQRSKTSFPLPLHHCFCIDLGLSLFDFNAYSPLEIARRVDQVGVSKARLPTLSMFMLGILAGAFIGLGALAFVFVKSDPNLGFVTGQLLGGLVFSLGLILVVVAGAELFTGNNLLTMAWADGKISGSELLKNWLVVCVANFVGATGLAILVFLSGHAQMNDGAIAEQYILIALAKSNLSYTSALFKGILCNLLVCLAVWMALAGRSVTDKIIAILFPVTVFVAAGFEHSVANMYLFPMAFLIQQFSETPSSIQLVTSMGFLHNMVPVLVGNIVGGSVLVALVYHVIYQRPQADKPDKKSKN